jgi:hypothetical protein
MHNPIFLLAAISAFFSYDAALSFVRIKARFAALLLRAEARAGAYSN